MCDSPLFLQIHRRPAENLEDGAAGLNCQTVNCQTVNCQIVNCQIHGSTLIGVQAAGYLLLVEKAGCSLDRS